MPYGINKLGFLKRSLAIEVDLLLNMDNMESILLKTEQIRRS